MSLEEFNESLLQDVVIRADAGSDFSETSFAEIFAEYLTESGEVSDFISCTYKNRGIRVDGFNYSSEEGLLDLFIVNYRPRKKVESLTRTDLDQILRRAESFLEKSLSINFSSQLEESTCAFELARSIVENSSNIYHVRFFVFSNTVLSGTVKELPDKEISGKNCSYHIWDLERLNSLISSTRMREDIVIDFENLFGSGLVCLPAHLSGSLFQSFLAVIPGIWLTEIYTKYGSRLLEQNVRTFLQVRGGVNKGIRKTILTEPQMFFAYNNGISATAELVETRVKEGVTSILKLTNFQIVNGGQTTVSIFNALKKEKGAKLDEISVQMKLTIVTPEKSSDVVPYISRYANSQNKISEADFFSNHPFHIRMEEFSKRVIAPPVAGSQIMTHWYYERARGQFQHTQAYMTPAKKKEFLLRYPKKQLFSKTDIAKFENTFKRLPYIVSLGAQKNFARFADVIGKDWEVDNTQFNEHYFRKIIAQAITFRTTEKLVLVQSWYSGGYRANIVTYGIALLVEKIIELRQEIDYEFIWRKQVITESMYNQLVKICKIVHDKIVSGASLAGVSNVTEWCKRQACWESVRNTKFNLNSDFLKELVSRGTEKSKFKDAVKTQLLDNEVDAQKRVLELGGSYWKRMREWNKKYHYFTPKELSILHVATMIPQKIPSGTQCKILIEIDNRAKENEFE